MRIKSAIILALCACLLMATGGHCLTRTNNLGLSILQRGEAWLVPWNDSFQRIDDRITTEDARHLTHSTAEANLLALLNDVPDAFLMSAFPRTYRLTGTFGSVAGVAIDFTDNGMPDVADVNDYVVLQGTYDSTLVDVGDVTWVKGLTGITIYNSGGNNTDTFECVIMYLTNDAFETYGNSARRIWYVFPDAAITNHGASGTSGVINTGSLADIVEYLTTNTTYGRVVLPSNHTYQIRQNVTVGDYVEIVAMPGAIIDNDYSIRTASYMWCLSGSGTSEYFLVGAGSVCGTSYVSPGIIAEPTKVLENNVALTAGTVGSLAVSEWDWSNNDSIGFSTVYVRLSDNTDPDGKAGDFVTAGVTFTASQFHAGAYQVFQGEGVWSIVPSSGEAPTEWWGVYGAAVNCQPAVQKAVKSANNIRLRPGKTYFLDSQVDIDETMTGSHTINAEGATIIGGSGLAAEAMFSIGYPTTTVASGDPSSAVTNFYWRGGTIQLDGAKGWMHLGYVHDAEIKDFFLQEVNGVEIAGSFGIHLVNSFGVYIKNFNIHGDKASSGGTCLTSGIKLESDDTIVGYTVLNNLHVEDGLIQRCEAGVNITTDVTGNGVDIQNIAILDESTPRAAYGVYLTGYMDDVTISGKSEQVGTAIYVDNGGGARYSINIPDWLAKMDNGQTGISLNGDSGYVTLGNIHGQTPAASTATLIGNVDAKVAVTGMIYAAGAGTTTLWDGTGGTERRFRILQPHNENKTADFDVQVYQDGYTYDNVGSTVDTIGSLPSLATIYDGFTVGFLCAEAGKSMVAQPNGTDRIARLTTTAGDYVSLSVPGSALQLRANVADGLWMPVYRSGQWADETNAYKKTTTVTLSAEGDLQSITIPANDMGVKGRLHVRAAGEKTGSAGTKALTLVWGGTSYTFHTAVNDTNDWSLDAVISNHSTASQKVTITGVNAATPAVVATVVATPAKDTTANVTLAIHAVLTNPDTVTMTDFEAWIE